MTAPKSFLSLLTVTVVCLLIQGGVVGKIVSMSKVEFQRNKLIAPPVQVDGKNDIMVGINHFFEIHESGDLFEHVADSLNTQEEGWWQSDKYPRLEVIATDDRLYIDHDPHAYPWSAFGRIEVGCTGSFIGPRHIVTAAHCVYGGGWNSRLDLEIRDNRGRLIDFASWERAFVPASWVENQQFNMDIALIVLTRESDIWLPLAPTNGSISKNIVIAGFPSDKRGEMWLASGTVFPQRDDWIYHDVDTKTGSSGSACWYMREDGQPQLQHIHNGYIAASRLNYATSIGASRYQWLCFLMQQTSRGLDICQLTAPRGLPIASMKPPRAPPEPTAIVTAVAGP